MSTESVWYVYGVAPSALAALPSVGGLDEAPVALETHAEISALVSVLGGADYESNVIETKSGDVEWLSPRAVAHDRVLTWVSDHGAVVPFPMFSLFSGRDAVQTMLRDRYEQLFASLARVGQAREYALRAYRVDAELMDAIPSLSPRLAQMAKEAADASPGQQYLLNRKLDGEKKSEMRVVTQRIVDELVTELSPHARGVVRSAIPKMTDAESARGTMVLNAAFLVPHAALDAFQKTLTTLVDRHGARGFRFDFTGPWPPYHFVSTTDGA